MWPLKTSRVGAQTKTLLPLCRRRCEALQRADQHSGPGEDVRLWHQRLPGRLRG